jgi:hypothetical protein
MELELQSEIEGIIDNLYRITVKALKPVTALLEDHATTHAIRDEEGNDVSYAFGSYALEVLSHRYAQISYKIGQRLADSITRRRRILLYRQGYWHRMRPVISLDSSHVDEHMTQDSPLVQVQHSDQVTDDSEGDQYEKEFLGIDRTGLWVDGPSGTTIIPPYLEENVDSALDAASVTTTATAASGYHEKVDEIPPPPSMAGREVECPYCFCILLRKDTSGNRWR